MFLPPPLAIFSYNCYMRKYLIVVLCVLWLNGNAQTLWSPPGATWHYELRYIFSNIISYAKIEYVGDTLIKGKTCKKLVKTAPSGLSCLDGYPTSYTYADSNKVYLYSPLLDTFTVMYDFNANTNDTWDMLIDSCSYTITVDTTDFVIINGDTLKRLYVTGIFGGEIIERLGHMGYMLPHQYEFFCASLPCDGAYAIKLNCYEDSTFALYKTDSLACDTVYFTSIAEHTLNHKLTIYPNPMVTEAVIELPFGKQEVALTLYDVIGREQAIKYSIANNQLTIKRGNLPSGIYFFAVTNGKQTYTGKLAVE